MQPHTESHAPQSIFTPTYLLPLDGTGRHEAVHHSRHRRLLVPARPARLLLLRLLQAASCLGHAAVGAHDQRGGGAAPAGHPGGAQLAVAAIKPRKLSMENKAYESILAKYA